MVLKIGAVEFFNDFFHAQGIDFGGRTSASTKK
jgi:hypothetical protein